VPPASANVKRHRCLAGVLKVGHAKPQALVEVRDLAGKQEPAEPALLPTSGPGYVEPTKDGAPKLAVTAPVLDTRKVVDVLQQGDEVCLPDKNLLARVELDAGAQNPLQEGSTALRRSRPPVGTRSGIPAL
jgi:hypothetical protein